MQQQGPIGQQSEPLIRQYDGSVMKEEGVVTGLIGGMAKVQTTQTDACGQCGMKGGCTALGGMKKREIVVKNSVHAKEGDHVMIAVPRKGVMGAGFVVYLLPILTMILGAAFGAKIGPEIGLDSQDASVLLGLLGLAVPWTLLYFISKQMSRQKALEVRIVKILSPGEHLRPVEASNSPGAL